MPINIFLRKFSTFKLIPPFVFNINYNSDPPPTVKQIYSFFYFFLHFSSVIAIMLYPLYAQSDYFGYLFYFSSFNPKIIQSAEFIIIYARKQKTESNFDSVLKNFLRFY